MKNVTGTTQRVRAMTDFDITSFVHELPGMAYRCQWNGTWSMEFVSLGCQTLTGYSCEQLIGETARPWNALIHPDDVAWVSEAIRSAIHGERPFQLVYRVHTRTGIERWVQEDGRGISMPGDDPFYLEGFVSDITARKHAEESLTDANATINRLIREDPLTGLANRRALEERIIPAMSYARRWEQPLSIIMADLDRFKNVNDKHGHLTGDQVLVSFAQRLQISCRIEDLLVRFGGEEFILLLPNTELAQAATLAERLREQAEHATLPVPEPVTASFGVTLFVPEDTKDSFISRADQAMYLAKANGRNRVEVLSPA